MGTMEEVDRQRGVVHILILIIILAAVAGGYYLISQGKISLPSNISLPGTKGASISLQTQNINPFDASSQYENPFNTYKNPFNNLKK